MAFELSWVTPLKVLCLKMVDSLSFEEFIEIDKLINARLEESDKQIALIVIASYVRIAPYDIEALKSTQRYLHSRQIDRLIVVSNNRLNRLAMMLLFNPSRAVLQFCTNFDHAQELASKTRF